MCRLLLADVICRRVNEGTNISTKTNNALIREALAEARKGLAEGGLPIGSVLADSAGNILARGHNLRVQTGDPTAHAEVACIRNAGRRRDWDQLTLVSTLSPCVMCTGTALLFRIPRVIIGENKNFRGAEDLMMQAGVEITILDDPECIEMMKTFTAEHPDLWNEDIGIP
jgi:cytosine deaminase